MQKQNLFKKNSSLNLNYSWGLENKATGLMHPTFTYASRESARKAVSSTSGRLANYKPVKVFKSKKSKVIPSLKSSSKTTSFSNRGFGNRSITKSRYITRRV